MIDFTQANDLLLELHYVAHDLVSIDEKSDIADIIDGMDEKKKRADDHIYLLGTLVSIVEASGRHRSDPKVGQLLLSWIANRQLTR